MSINNTMTDLIDKACKNRLEKEPPRDYLGGSRLGVSCERIMFFEYNNVSKDEGKEFEGRTARIFERGHLVEDMVADWLEIAGFKLETIDKETGEQYRFKLEDSPISGGCDGIITYSPIPEIPTPCLWENKAIGVKSFEWIKKRGRIQFSKPEYYVQMQVYMKAFDLKYGLFTAVNMDSMEIHYEVVPYKEKVAIEALERGKRVVEATFFEELPKAKDAPNCFPCDWCSYRETCNP